MNRRKKRENKNESTFLMPIIGVVVLVGIIAFALAYLIYGNSLNKIAKNNNNKNIISSKIQEINTLNNDLVEQTGSSIGKSVNEIKDDNSNFNEVEKRAINTSNVEKKVLDQRSNEKEQENNKKESEDSVKVANSNNVEKSEGIISFEKPVDGEIIKNFSNENLVYSNTLDEWCTHLGIDYQAEKTSIVKSVADGEIKTIKNDPRYGLTVVVKHADGFETMYANLLSTEFITVGEKVVKGQTIATVGNTASFEAADETHLHFEMRKNGEIVDPNIYIK